MIYDFYANGAWLDSCEVNEFSPARLLAILTKRWANVRMVVRGEQPVMVESFTDWLKLISQSGRAVA